MQTEELASKLFALLKGNGLKIRIFDEDGNDTSDPEQGRRFFVTNPNIMVTIDETSNSIELSKGSGATHGVAHLQKAIKQLADQFLMNSGIKVFGKSIRPKDYAYQAKANKGNMMETAIKPVNSLLLGQVMHQLGTSGDYTAAAIADALGTDSNRVQQVLNRLVKDGKVVSTGRDTAGNPMYSKSMEEAITEGFSKMFGSRKTSRQTLEHVNIVVRHRMPVDEQARGARTRHISAIFLEMAGQRHQMPNTNIWCARAMAQHMAHGGQIADRVGQHILERTDQLAKLQGFNKYVVANGLINESSVDIVCTVRENVQAIKGELKRMANKRAYESARARIMTMDREALAESDTDELKELFTIKRFDEQYADVLPIVSQLMHSSQVRARCIEEAACNTVFISANAKSTAPVFEFKTTGARLAYKLSELAGMIVDNPVLVEFVTDLSTKVRTTNRTNAFERAIMEQILGNLKVKQAVTQTVDITESVDLEAFFDAFENKFL